MNYAVMENAMEVRYLSKGLDQLYNYVDVTDDVEVRASKYLNYYGNLTYLWTTNPKIPNIHGSTVSSKLTSVAKM